MHRSMQLEELHMPVTPLRRLVIPLTLIPILALTLASPLAAQEEHPDFSRATLTRLFADQQFEAGEQTRQNTLGAFGLRALGTSFSFSPFGLAEPLSGSGVGLGDVTQTWPDPFSLTGTQIATSPRAARAIIRARNAELRRIDRMERARLSVSSAGGD